jgi:hypothetical protein
MDFYCWDSIVCGSKVPGLHVVKFEARLSRDLLPLYQEGIPVVLRDGGGVDIKGLQVVVSVVNSGVECSARGFFVDDYRVEPVRDWAPCKLAAWQLCMAEDGVKMHDASLESDVYRDRLRKLDVVQPEASNVKEYMYRVVGSGLTPVAVPVETCIGCGTVDDAARVTDDQAFLEMCRVCPSIWRSHNLHRGGLTEQCVLYVVPCVEKDHGEDAYYRVQVTVVSALPVLTSRKVTTEHQQLSVKPLVLPHYNKMWFPSLWTTKVTLDLGCKSTEAVEISGATVEIVLLFPAEVRDRAMRALRASVRVCQREFPYPTDDGVTWQDAPPANVGSTPRMVVFKVSVDMMKPICVPHDMSSAFAHVAVRSGDESDVLELCSAVKVTVTSTCVRKKYKFAPAALSVSPFPDGVGGSESGEDEGGGGAEGGAGGGAGGDAEGGAGGPATWSPCSLAVLCSDDECEKECGNGDEIVLCSREVVELGDLSLVDPVEFVDVYPTKPWTGPAVVRMWSRDHVRTWLVAKGVDTKVADVLWCNNVDGLMLTGLFFAEERIRSGGMGMDMWVEVGVSNPADVRAVARACDQLDSASWALCKDVSLLVFVWFPSGTVSGFGC